MYETQEQKTITPKKSPVIVKSRGCSQCGECLRQSDLKERILTMRDCGNILPTHDINIQSPTNTHTDPFKAPILITTEDHEVRRKIISLATGDHFIGMTISSPVNEPEGEFIIPVNNCIKFSDFSKEHDNEPHNHNLRVGYLSKYLGELILDFILRYGDSTTHQSLFYNEKEKIKARLTQRGALERLLGAGIVHDIGKIMIPDEILNKNGPLTESEYEIVKQHTKYGYALLHDLFDFQLSPITALYHHEKWDGTGYNKLKNTNIKFQPNIVAAADIIDAMATNRPYRAAISYSRLYNMIIGKSEDKKGNFYGHFHPLIVHVLTNNWDQIVEKHQKLRNGDFSQSIILH